MISLSKFYKFMRFIYKFFMWTYKLTNVFDLLKLNTGETTMSYKLYFKYGVMGCSKTAQALMTKFNYEQQGYNVLLMKPSIDNRDDHENKTVIK